MTSHIFLLLEPKCTAKNTEWNCCNKDHKCNEYEGDCQLDSDCVGDLVCGSNNCPSDFPDLAYDCCEKRSGNFSKYLLITIY